HQPRRRRAPDRARSTRPGRSNVTLSESEPRLAAPADGAPVDAPALPMEEPRAAVAVASRARRRWRNWSSVLAVGWLVLVVLLALLADLLPVEPYDRPVG